MSKIEWTGRTWNPVVGCTRVSPGCDNCYAVRMTKRLEAMGQEKYAGLVNPGKGHFNGVARLVPEDLALPLRWRKPARVFVNSMSDLFHEALSFEQIAAVFGVMAATPRHRYQVLTKRPGRAAEWYRWIDEWCRGSGMASACMAHADEAMGTFGTERELPVVGPSWPLQNLEMGTSVEDQPTADLRIPKILRCPAAIHFASYEPALGEVRFAQGCDYNWLDPLRGPGLDWIIVGGESGPGARPFDIAWARSTVRQCQDAGVPVFVKQLGAHPWRRLPAGVGVLDYELPLRDRKGGDPSEWPEDLRVREFPEARP